MSKMHTNNG